MANLPFFMNFQSNDHVAENFDLISFNSMPPNYLFHHPQEDASYGNVLESYQKSSAGNTANDPHARKKSGALPVKNVIHKMIERQRRKDMNLLCSQLKSLLPQETLRGKRSVTDQLLEAANYIRHLEQQIRDLTKQRDNNSTQRVCFNGVKISKSLPFHESDEGFPSVKINSVGPATFQVFINTFQRKIAFSYLVMVLEENGLEIISSAYSSINERVFHTMHIKVSNPNRMNIDALSLKLWHLIR